MIEESRWSLLHFPRVPSESTLDKGKEDSRESQKSDFWRASGVPVLHILHPGSPSPATRSVKGHWRCSSDPEALKHA